MNAMKNRVQLIGNLGMNPEIKNLKNDKTMARFSMATNESYKRDNGEKVTETQWHNIVAWNGTATLIEKLLHKGDEVALEGKLTNRSWDDKERKKHYTTEVVASEFHLLRTKDKE